MYLSGKKKNHFECICSAHWTRLIGVRLMMLYCFKDREIYIHHYLDFNFFNKFKEVRDKLYGIFKVKFYPNNNIRTVNVTPVLFLILQIILS